LIASQRSEANKLAKQALKHKELMEKASLDSNRLFEEADAN
jgi:hypothetical protein